MTSLTRQIGGALGVAAIGSGMALVYNSYLAQELHNFVPSARESISGSIQQTLSYATATANNAPAAAAKDAHVQALHLGAIGSALVAFIGALVALIWLPRNSSASSVATAPTEAMA
ncbi:hypothetical protein [Dyella sp. S184]|uniref:hypothetical protein n=1 Tax=Dyella sp. S184 TaxID=1641862 RepID=UPI00131AB514|nr:hypothetical protein [Dyella sp. S184]